MNHPQKKSSIQQQIFKAEQDAYLVKPNPPSQTMIERAKFVDKTYKWNGR